MNKILIALLALTFVASAQAATYHCTGDGNLTVSISGGKMTLVGLEGTTSGSSNVHGDFDSSYHPRATHAGSTRYNLTDACDEGSVSAILDKSMSEDKSGRLTIDNACDTDGGSPSFDVYDCKAK